MQSKVVFALWVVLLLGGSGALWVSSALTVATSSATTFTGETPAVAPRAASAALSEPVADAAQPRLRIDRTEYSFGTMELGESQSHTFVVRNAGNAPLTLKVDDTSCKCTRCDVGDGVVPPGEEQSIVLEWKATEAIEVFRHGANIATNDKQTPVLSLTALGRVRSCLAASPATLVFSDLTRQEPATATVLVYSQVWESFEIHQVTSSLKKLNWKVRPASAEALETVQATAGYEVEIRAGEDLPPGRFCGQVQIHVASVRRASSSQDTASGDPPPLQIDVAGNVVPNVSLFSPGLDLSGWNVGTLLYGEGAHKKLLLTVRGDRQVVRVTESIIKPEFVQVRFEREGANGTRSTRYGIEIEIPKSSKPGTYKGEVLLRIDHPERSELRIPLSFSVAPPSVPAPR